MSCLKFHLAVAFKVTIKMPRTKAFRRSQAMKRRRMEQGVTPLLPAAWTEKPDLPDNDSMTDSDPTLNHPNDHPNDHPMNHITNITNIKTSSKSVKNHSKNSANVKMSVMPCPTFPQNSVVQGSFHQGDPRFGENSNRQCAANSLMAILKGKLKNVLTWTTEDLDDVLLCGDDLYSGMRRDGRICDPTGCGFISVNEL
ncbi:hypothetical protein ANANG_G00319420, partial [Anguilla anguilla]